jgi:hypothetical protein
MTTAVTAGSADGASTGRTDPRWGVVAGLGAWSMVVWAARLVNIWRDLLLSTDEKVVATITAVVFVVLGVAVLCIGIGLRRWPPTRVDIITVGVLGGWTCGVWFLRMFDIVSEGDHGAAFIVVHGVLALISVGLAAWSWNELGIRTLQEIVVDADPLVAERVGPAGALPEAVDAGGPFFDRSAADGDATAGGSVDAAVGSAPNGSDQ